MQSYGPQTLIADQIHAEKYRAPNETFREAMTRVANALSDNEQHFKAFRDILLDQRFLPAGRIQNAMGSLTKTTPYNCYVSGTIEDSYVDGQGSIMERAKQAAQTMRMGGGIGYDFSTIRPKGALIRKQGSNASGPVSFMGIYNAVCIATASAGNRRGAQMGVLRVDHPDIEEFIRAKQNQDQLTGFNISIAITDEFMQAVKARGNFTLRWDGDPYKEIFAPDLWEMIMRSTYDWAEPGVLFIDRINSQNNLRYCETIAATNPCGEQPLPPFGACLLGSFNLTRYLSRNSPSAPWEFNWSQFFNDVPVVVRAMDNVVDRARYPLEEQEREAHRKRRMGLGVTGAANTIEALGHPYGSDGFIRYLRVILTNLRNSAYEASAKLAREKGPFKMYSPEYLNSPFIQELPEHVYSLIESHGIRNSHLLSIAPTGTISLSADNVSSGIEPVFAHSVKRRIRSNDGTNTYEVHEIEDYGSRVLGVHGKVSGDCTIEDHLRVLITASALVDSAVSKTCNVPTDIPWEDFKSIYFRAWEAGCKGCTTFRSGGQRGGILTDAKGSNPAPDETSVLRTTSGAEEGLSSEGALACSIDPETGERSCE